LIDWRFERGRRRVASRPLKAALIFSPSNHYARSLRLIAKRERPARSPGPSARL